MTFSFRVGTNWCHDFPKLARDSGFHFSVCRSQARVDWNRIRSIDIDRVIRERDFVTIEENIDNVIDYCLESEYDAKILDPNFVKLFRLAQLAVEYLLYCKQYLDHSVVILKDELKAKIEDNVKLKKDLSASEEIIKQLKEKAKEKKKLLESSIVQSNGEIHKCPYCPKTFVSAVFVAAHAARRHPYMSEFSVSSSPVHEHYRAETEKLHNEIKALKERLNETERVIGNESENTSENKRNRIAKKEIMCEPDKNEAFKEQQTKYQTEINTLKSILFDEIRNLKEKGANNSYKLHETAPDINMKSLISQQEREIQRLKDQLQEKVTPDIESVHLKLQMQEHYWKSKLEKLEYQHQLDIENLTSELKLTQQAANRIKHEYEVKVGDLERRSMNQSTILTEQCRQLDTLTGEMNQSHVQKERGRDENPADFTVQRFCESERRDSNAPENGTIVIEDVDSIDSQESVRDSTDKLSKTKFSQSMPRDFTLSRRDNVSGHVEASKPVEEKDETRIDHSTKPSKRDVIDYPLIKRLRPSQNVLERNVSRKPDSSLNSPDRRFDSRADKATVKSKDDKSRRKESDDAFEKTDESSESASSATESESDSGSTATSTEYDDTKDDKSALRSKSDKIVRKTTTSNSQKDVRETAMPNQRDVREIFDKRLMDLGIGPDWEGIPRATFEQKMEIVKHHQSINAKKFPQYKHIKSKLIEEIFNRISGKEKGKQSKSSRSPLDKLVTNVKSKAAKAFNVDKDARRSILKTKEATSRRNSIIDTQQTKKHASPKNSVKQSSPSLLFKKYERSTESSLRLSVKQTQPIFDLYKNLKNRRHSVSCAEGDNRVEKLTKEVSSSYDDIEDPRAASNGVDDRSKSTERLPVEEGAMEHSAQFSPQNNRSVLKSSIGSLGNLTKKKVLFDLKDAEDRSFSLHDLENNKERNFDEWNVSSFSAERSQPERDKKSSSADNIVLRTTQSDKIAEITKKIEEQLRISRQKPVGAIEAMFLPSRVQEVQKYSTEKQQPDSDVSSISISTENSAERIPVISKETSKDLPQPAPRTFKEKGSNSIRQRDQTSTKDSDLDLDIDEILQLT